MGTPRWQLREMEQQRLLEKLLRKADKIAGDSYYEFYRQLAVSILAELPKISRFIGLPPDAIEWHPTDKPTPELSRFFTSAVNIVRQFSRTGEEAIYLLWELLEKAVGRTSHSFTRGYSSQKVLEQEKVYGGNATDDAPEEEVQATLRD